MAVREVLRYRDVENVTLVDLDPRVTEVFRENSMLSALNADALNDPRVVVINEDAWEYLERNDTVFDINIIDLPDPKSIALSRLYTRQFYGLVVERLSAHGLFVTQAGSPFFARQAFWSVVETLEATRNPQRLGQGLNTIPYHSYVPSFGEWGFVLASPEPVRDRNIDPPQSVRYLTNAVWHATQEFGKDIDRVGAEPNTLQSHILTEYYLDGWDYWFR